MHCYMHEQFEAVGACVNCGKLICTNCMIEIKGRCYCKRCVDEVFDEKTKRIEALENNENKSRSPMVFMNAGGGSSSNSSSNSSLNTGRHIEYYCTKSKVTAGILALLLGGIGVHKFYLGNIGLGILYIIFFWTAIPAFIGFIEGIILLTMSDEVFAAKYGTRVYH